VTFEDKTTLGRTGLRVSRLGIGSSYGAPGAAVERAFHEHGVNFLYWGSVRRRGLRDAIRNLAGAGREKIVVALQTYDRSGFLMRYFVERGLRALRLDHADVLILGFHKDLPAPRVLDAARRLVRDGKVRFVALSGHRRTLFGELGRERPIPVDVFMFRYNAAHRGAEHEIFPFLPKENRPGTIAFTATRWGHLLDPRRMPPGEKPLTGSDCYRFALSRPEVDLCLAGPASVGELDEALRALALGPLAPEELEQARRVGKLVRSR
jgi:aryl-alcohol dehydrogenase-like predicted oxidoreductase